MAEYSRSLVDAIGDPSNARREQVLIRFVRRAGRKLGPPERSRRDGDHKNAYFRDRRTGKKKPRRAGTGLARALTLSRRYAPTAWAGTEPAGGELAMTPPPRVAAGELHQYPCRIRLTVFCVSLSDGGLGAA